MSTEAEKVLPAAGYEDKYLVTSTGRVFSKTALGGETHTYAVTTVKKGKTYYSETRYVTKGRRGRWLKPQFNGKYYHVALPRRKIKLIHQLVAETFIPNTENKPHINHIDGNKLNNDVSNLEWCTPKENVSHAYWTGLSVAKMGDECHHTRIPEAELPVIKKLYASGKPQREIAKFYGVDQSHISRIVNNHLRGRKTLCQI